MTTKKTDKVLTMADLLASSSVQIKGVFKLQKLDAKFIEINENCAFFDIGGKALGKLSGDDYDEVRDYVKTLKKGDSVRALVLDPEDREGHVRLSLRHSAADSVWQRLNEALTTETPVRVITKAVSDRGITVELFGIIGFIPSSQIGKELLEKKEGLIGQPFRAIVTDLDKSRNKVLLSERAVSEASDIKLEQKALKAIKIGEIYKGIVTQITSFGAFVELSITVEKDTIPVEGLVHVSEISYKNISDASDVLSEGDTVSVKALDIHDGKLSLSIKQTQSNPWNEAIKKYTVDSKHAGKVVKTSSFGVFVELEPGIEGLIHMTKIPPTMQLKKGAEVNVYVEEVDEKEKRIALGIVLTQKPVGYR